MRIFAWITLLLLVGCTTSQEMLVRKGYTDLRVGDYHNAEKKAGKVLEKDEFNHRALYLRAQARASQGRVVDALRDLENMNNLCHQDSLCLDRAWHVKGNLLQARLTGKGFYLDKALEDVEALDNESRTEVLAALIRRYEEEGNIRQAAALFDEYRKISGPLSQDELLRGVLLYHACLRIDEAKELYTKLSPTYREKARQATGNINF